MASQGSFKHTSKYSAMASKYGALRGEGSPARLPSQPKPGVWDGFKAPRKVATERGCCKLTLEVLSNNPRAMGSYTKFGFKSYELDPELGTAQFWEKKLE